MTSIVRLRSKLRSVRRARGDALIDVAYHAKVHPTTVGKFERGVTAHPTFLTLWGLRKYLQRQNNLADE